MRNDVVSLAGTSKGLLIVDDDPNMTRLIGRCVKGRFDGLLYLASTPNEAVSKLQQAGGTITHIVCDWDLGGDYPKGDQLLPEWRRTFKGITRGVIWTGSEMDCIKPHKSIDAIVQKGTDIQPLFQALGV